MKGRVVRTNELTTYLGAIPKETAAMHQIRKITICLGILGVFVTAQSLEGRAQGKTNMAGASAVQFSTERDGSHDFDFLIGNWKAHLRRLIDPKTGLTTSDSRVGVWVEYDGISNHRKLLDTNADFEQFDVKSGKAHLRIRGQTLRMYNPDSHQWSIYGLDLDKGELELPPLVGQFNGRRGEFFDSELRNGRMVQVRYIWTDISPKSARMVQSFSPDGGKSWVANWICDLSR
jgi:hypothetical protein